MNYNEYVAALIDNFWVYAEQEFGNHPELLERSNRDERRPPKFTKLAAENNLLCPPNASDSIQQAIRGAVPSKKRHPHFARARKALAEKLLSTPRSFAEGANDDTKKRYKATGAG